MTSRQPCRINSHTSATASVTFTFPAALHSQSVLITALFWIIILSFPLYSLSNCSITEEGFSSLASALRSNPSHMRELWLNGSKAGDSGVKHLSSLLEDPNCNLDTDERRVGREC